MVNFRFHLVSIVAVFLALAIGVIMGTTVIDRALVDTLESQQESLEARIERVLGENDELRRQVSDLEQAAEQLSEEGSQRLVAGALADVPVLVVGLRDAEVEGIDELLDLLGSAGADLRGRLWLTSRFELETEEDRSDLAAAVGERPSSSPATLRRLALQGLADRLRLAAAPAPDGPPDPGSEDRGGAPGPDVTVAGPDPSTGQPVERPPVADALLASGFVEGDAAPAAAGDVLAQVVPGTRVLFLAGDGTDAGASLAQPLLEALVEPEGMGQPIPTVAVGAAPGDEDVAALVAAVRADDELRGMLSTVDNVHDFAGRLATVLALEDLGVEQTGHYGREPGAERLLPAPVTDG